MTTREVLDADAEGALAVVAGLDRQDHAGQQRLERRGATGSAGPRARRGRRRRRGRCRGRSRARPARARARATASMSRPARPARQAQPATSRSWPFSTRVKGRIAVGRHRADGDGAGDVGGAVGVLRAAVDEQELARRDLAVRGLGDPVVHDGAVRAGAGDGVEGDVAQRAGGGAERLELASPRRSRSARPRARSASSQARNSATAAPSRRCAARVPAISAAVLAAPWAGCRGRAPQTTSARRRRRAGRRPRPARWPGRRRPGRASASSAGPKAAGGSDGDLGAEVGAQRGVGLGRVGEELDPGVGVEDGEGERHRRAGDVRAADVEEPGDRVGQRQHRRREVARDEAAGELGALVGRGCGRRARPGAARSAAAGGGGWSGQARSTRFATRTRPICRGPSASLSASISLRGVQPGVEAERGRRRAAPRASQSAGLSSGMRRTSKAAASTWSADLQPVAAVDEDRRRGRAVTSAMPGRAGEAGQPGQPLVARRHVLALVRVGARHQEGVDAGLGHRRAQRREPRRRRSRAWCGGGSPGASARPFRPHGSFRVTSASSPGQSAARGPACGGAACGRLPPRRSAPRSRPRRSTGRD